MVQTVGSVNSLVSASPLAPGATVAGLEARLTQYQKQLSDCVNCESAKTSKGKEDIRDLSGKIGELKARIDQVSGSGAKAITAPPAAAPLRDTITSTATAFDATTASGAPKPRSDATVGSIIDVLA